MQLTSGGLSTQQSGESNTVRVPLVVRMVACHVACTYLVAYSVQGPRRRKQADTSPTEAEPRTTLVPQNRAAALELAEQVRRSLQQTLSLKPILKNQNNTYSHHTTPQTYNAVPSNNNSISNNGRNNSHLLASSLPPLLRSESLQIMVSRLLRLPSFSPLNGLV